MTTLTKKQAHLLSAHDYRLVDEERKIWEILRVSSDWIDLVSDPCDFKTIDAQDVGEDFFILARDYSQLTQEIEHEGERFVPLDKLFMKDIDSYENVDLLHTWHLQPIGIPKEFIKPIVDTKN